MLPEFIAFVNNHFHYILIIFFFIIGSCIGSFLNVCSLRLPRHISIIFPGSQCMCGKLIPWYFNLPICGWIILRGRAACCRVPISVRYFYVELFMGILYGFLWWRFQNTQALFGMVFSFFLILIILIHISKMSISNGLLLITTCIGILIHYLQFRYYHNLVHIPFILQFYCSLKTCILSILISSGYVLWLGLFLETLVRKDFLTVQDVFFTGILGTFIDWQTVLADTSYVFGSILIINICNSLFQKPKHISNIFKQLPVYMHAYIPLLATCSFIHWILYPDPNFIISLA